MKWSRWPQFTTRAAKPDPVSRGGGFRTHKAYRPFAAHSSPITSVRALPFHRPFLDLPLSFHCLSLTFHRLFTALPGPSTAFPLPFLGVSPSLHCLQVQFDHSGQLLVTASVTGRTLKVFKLLDEGLEGDDDIRPQQIYRFVVVIWRKFHLGFWTIRGLFGRLLGGCRGVSAPRQVRHGLCLVCVSAAFHG